MKRAKGPGAQRQDQEKLDLVKTYLMLDKNLSLAAKTLAIPYQTALGWKNHSAWWDAIEQKLLQQEEIQMSGRLKKIIDLSSAAIVERLEKGDWVFNQKKGTIERKPVTMRDAAMVLKEAKSIEHAARQQIVEEVDKQSIKDTLAQLAKNFEELAQKQKEKPKIEVTDVVFIEESK